MAAAVVLGVATAAAIIAQAALLAYVVTAAFIDGRSLAELRGAIVALVAVSAARGALAWGYDVAGHVGASRVMSELRGRVVERVLRARPAGLDGERSGDLVTTAVQGVDALEAYFARYVPQLALSALVPVAILAWIAPRDWRSAVILAATLPLIPLFMVLIGRAAQRSARRRFRALQAFGGRFLDVVQGLPTLRANGRAEAQGTILRRAGDRFRAETMATLRVAFLSALVLELAATLGVALVAVAIGLRLAGGHMGLETGLAVLVLAPELYQPLRQLGTQFHASADGLAAAGRLIEVVDLPSALAPDGTAELPHPGAAEVRLEAVWHAYPTRPEPALRGLDLVVRPGERVALVGPSGAGKSTAAALLLRLADPDRGRVSVGGVDLRDGSAAAWRRRTAWVRQRPALLAGSVAENVRMGDDALTDGDVRAALAAAGVAEVVERLPEGIETRVGEAGAGLSTGEAQRVCLARALARRDAGLVVLDEPTAALDAAAADAVADAIAAIPRDRSVVLVTHSPALAARMDRVVELRDGRTVAPPSAPDLAAAA
jgi:thiol reductant ABC exporter CydD subunit